MSSEDFTKAKEINDRISKFISSKIEQKEKLKVSLLQDNPSTKPERPTGNGIKIAKENSADTDERRDCITM